MGNFHLALCLSDYWPFVPGFYKRFNKKVGDNKSRKSLLVDLKNTIRFSYK